MGAGLGCGSPTWAKDAAPYRHPQLQSTQVQQLGADGQLLRPVLVEVVRYIETVPQPASGDRLKQLPSLLNVVIE